MNKGFYIGGIVLSFVFMILSFYYIGEIHSARLSEFLRSYQDYNSYSYSNMSSVAGSLTTEIAAMSLIFFLYFIAAHLLGLLKVKTTTSKVFSIIGLSITFIFLLWDFAVLASPSAMSFDEVGVAWVFYALIMIAFSIVGLVQSIRFEKGHVVSKSSDILDS